VPAPRESPPAHQRQALAVELMNHRDDPSQVRPVDVNHGASEERSVAQGHAAASIFAVRRSLPVAHVATLGRRA
jgi:hypothetical protein